MASSAQAHIDSITTVFDDGNHNAFTDLCGFGGRLFLTFRSCPDGHGVHASSAIVVMCSTDGDDWCEAFRFGVSHRDVRDPHFLVFNNTLFVYTGAWLCDPDQPERRDLNDHLGYAAWSRDGVTWEGPRFLEGTYGHYIWRGAAYGGKAYLCARRRHEFPPPATDPEGGRQTESAMLESDDGLVWRFRALFQEEYGDETAFLFENDGSVLAIARTLGARPAQVCRAAPPYDAWTRANLDRYIGGPLLAKWGARYLVGGRRILGGAPPRTALYWLVNNELEPCAELPSGGDNSYPGFLQTGEDRALVSYYSSHEGSGTSAAPAAIYLARLRLP